VKTELARWLKHQIKPVEYRFKFSGKYQKYNFKILHAVICPKFGNFIEVGGLSLENPFQKLVRSG
jgi:hypothetical protein